MSAGPVLLVSLVPAWVVTVTVVWAGPFTPPGVVTTHEVAVQLTGVAAVPPKLTLTALTSVLNPVPVIVTDVPPATGPEFGDIPVTVTG
jgi:hypothetical protein